MEQRGYNERTHKIISCFGKLTNKSTAKVLGVSQAWVSHVWQREGLDYDDEDFKAGWF